MTVGLALSLIAGAAIIGLALTGIHMQLRMPPRCPEIVPKKVRQGHGLSWRFALAQCNKPPGHKALHRYRYREPDPELGSGRWWYSGVCYWETE